MLCSAVCVYIYIYIFGSLLIFRSLCNRTGSAILLEHSWEFRLFLLLPSRLFPFYFASLSDKYSHTLLAGENLQPPERIVAPFSVRSLDGRALRPTCTPSRHHSGIQALAVSTQSWKMPWILSVFEIRTRATGRLDRILMVAACPFYISLRSLLLLSLVSSSTYTRVCTTSTSQPGLFLSVLRSLALFLPSPLTVSNRPFPFLLSSPQLFSHVLFLRVSRSGYIHPVYLPRESDSMTKEQEYRMRMLSTERTFRWSEWEITPLARSTFLLRSCLGLFLGSRILSTVIYARICVSASLMHRFGTL